MNDKNRIQFKIIIWLFYLWITFTIFWNYFLNYDLHITNDDIHSESFIYLECNGNLNQEVTKNEKRTKKS